MLITINWCEPKLAKFELHNTPNYCKMKKRIQKASSLLFGLLLYICAYSQSSSIIKGKVTDESGVPVANVSVKIKGTGTGTTTSKDGSFQINAALNSTIVLSGIGYEPREVLVTSMEKIEVVLSKGSQSLSEVVVTALGVKREKRNLTFSSQEIKSEELLRAKDPNLLNDIDGKVSGVQITSATGAPGSSSRILIRGATSIFGDNQALIVLDGVPIDNSETGTVNNGPGTNRLADIDPAIVESINILKGAAATALYGSAGARGVVIITTKNGAGTKKPLITVSSDLSFDSPIFPKLQTKYSQGDRGVYFDGEANKTSSSWGALMDTLKVNGAPIQRHNPLKEFFRTGITSNSTISAAGGSANSSYFVSYSYFNQKGTVPKTDFIRHSVFAKSTNKISDQLGFTIQFNYSNSQINRIPEGYNLESPIWTVYTAPNSWNPLPYLNPDGTQRVYRFSRNNPYWVLDNISTNNNVNRFLPVANINYTPLKWLTISERIGADIYQEQVKYHESAGSVANPLGVLVDQVNTFRQFNHDLIIDARKKISDFDIDLLLGNNILSTYRQYVQGRGVGLSVNGFNNLANASTQTYTETHYLTRKVGFYAQANIDYKKILVLALTGRYDGSSVLSKDKSFYPYGSAAGGFIFSELLTGKLASVINFAKLRVSYATVGNDNVGAYQLNTPFLPASVGNATIGTIAFPFQGQNGFLLSPTLGNPQLQNELNKEFEVGLETRLWHDKLGFELSYFDRNVVNGIIPGVSVSPATGYSGTTVNSAKLETKGVELLIHGTPVKLGKFSWDVTFNYTKLNNKVLSLYGDITQLNLGFTQAIVGQSYGAIFGDRFARNAQGQLLIGADGLPYKDNTQGILGNISPNWLAGLTNSFRYGQFACSFFFDMKKGGDIQNNVDGYGLFYGTPKITEVRGPMTAQGISVVDNKPNTVKVDAEDYYRRLNSVLEAVIQDGTFIKLRNVTVSYDLKPSLLAKTPFKSGSIVVTGRNLWIYSPHFTGGDPETNSFGSSNANEGIYSFSTPTSRSVNISLKFSF